MKHVDAQQAHTLLAERPLDIVDVREPREWATGHLPGARLVPLDRLASDPRGVLTRDGVIFVCARGGRSQTAARLAEQTGLTEVYTLDGGTEAWVKAGLTIEVPAPAIPSAPAPPPAGGPSAEAAAEEEAGSPALDAVIGANLKALRARRGLSLDETARLTGIGRALLGQLELGQVAPSVAAVWKIARAFQVPFAALLHGPGHAATTVLRRSAARRLVGADGRFSSRALFPFGESTQVEFYELWLAPHGREEAEAHAPGTRENLVVTSGSLVLGIDGQRHELGAGDAIVFTADVPHVYENPGASETWMHLVMSYATSEAR